MDSYYLDWASARLPDRVTIAKEDLKDGVILIRLLSILTGAVLEPNLHQNILKRAQENAALIKKFIQQNIDPGNTKVSDITSGNENDMMAIVVRLHRRFATKEEYEKKTNSSSKKDPENKIQALRRKYEEGKLTPDDELQAKEILKKHGIDIPVNSTVIEMIKMMERLNLDRTPRRPQTSPKQEPIGTKQATKRGSTDTTQATSALPKRGSSNTTQATSALPKQGSTDTTQATSALPKRGSHCLSEDRVIQRKLHQHCLSEDQLIQRKLLQQCPSENRLIQRKLLQQCPSENRPSQLL
eukprot:TRINITY_DN125_c0_g1_i22.p1 TRINITY_DN125_c0_g1~~TRINITY_DN125_c0_g1_i22.p1  ORF type:complete len:298 (+),score=-9.94 TRINITY_DN125_c0_g1_i22:192-1085(+)